MKLEEVRTLVTALKRFQREMGKKDSPWFEVTKRRRELVAETAAFIEVVADDAAASGDVK